MDAHIFSKVRPLIHGIPTDGTTPIELRVAKTLYSEHAEA